MDSEPPIDEKLPYHTQPMCFPDGSSVEEFIIPDEDKEIVLEQLYPFSPLPKLTDVLYDMHADKTFVVKDFGVTWEHGLNFLVSPYYPEHGGIVIDWVDENAWVDDESDGSELDDLNDIDDSSDDSSPF